MSLKINCEKRNLLLSSLNNSRYRRKCCKHNHHNINNQNTTFSSSKSNISLMADKLIENLFGKLSKFKDDQIEKKNLTTNSNDHNRTTNNNDEDNNFCTFVKQIFLISVLIGFIYLLSHIDHRHRHMLTSENGSMFHGVAYRDDYNNLSYFYWNNLYRSRNINDNTIEHRNNHIMVHKSFDLKHHQHEQQSKSLLLSSSTLDKLSKMDNGQFTRYLFDHIQMWID